MVFPKVWCSSDVSRTRSLRKWGIVLFGGDGRVVRLYLFLRGEIRYILDSLEKI